MVRVPGVLGVGPRRRGISSPLPAEGAAGVAAGEGGVCDGVLMLLVLPGVVVVDAPGDVDAAGGGADGEGDLGR